MTQMMLHYIKLQNIKLEQPSQHSEPLKHIQALMQKHHEIVYTISNMNLFFKSEQDVVLL